MIVCCPVCQGSLATEGESLVCQSCRTTYQVAVDVPLLVATSSAQHQHQRRYFDTEFAALEDYRFEHWRRSFNDRIFRALELGSRSGAYLDVGVGGTGATVIEAARLGIPSTGCDLSVEGVLSARRFARGEGVAADLTTFVVCAAEALPFPGDSFESASAIAVLEHLDDDEPAVSELARVLAPGGRVWITVPHAYRLMPPFVWPAYWLHDRRLGHRRHYGVERLQALFQRHGFTLVEAQFTGHPVKLLQYALALAANRVERDGAQVWWALERADLRAVRRPLWAMQLSAVFELAA